MAASSVPANKEIDEAFERYTAASTGYFALFDGGAEPDNPALREAEEKYRTALREFREANARSRLPPPTTTELPPPTALRPPSPRTDESLAAAVKILADKVDAEKEVESDLDTASGYDDESGGEDEEVLSPDGDEETGFGGKGWDVEEEVESAPLTPHVPFNPFGGDEHDRHFLPDAGPFERFYQKPTVLGGHKKFFPDTDPFAIELSNKNIEPSKHVMDSALQNLVPSREPLHAGYSLELGRRAVEKAENHVRDEFAEGFRLWLAQHSGLPRSEAVKYLTAKDGPIKDSVNTALKRTVDLVGHRSLKLGQLPGVASYLDSFVDAQVAFEKKLVALIMNGPKNLEDSYMYYKYIVLKQKPEPAEIAAMFSPAF
jgi:hypothetical protein